uniref:VIT domain-containing protein n=1 Tax=Seriola dumerili TaxID=41447 RepID=A0A3B4UEK1_SERDU
MFIIGFLFVSRSVPLKSIEVELEVRDHVATVVSTLTYENKEDKPVEAVFVFPLPGDAAVCHFSAKIGQTQIVAEVKEKQQAREEYDDALSSGQQAFLLEESEQSPDIFTLSVGSLPPGESASIRLEYVTELAVQADDGLRFCLPAVLNPRYQPQGSEGASVQVTSVPVSLVPYSLSFSARVSSPRPVSKVESNCSLDPLQHLNTDVFCELQVKLAAGHKFDRDVELLIYYKDAHQPTAVVEAGQTTAKTGDRDVSLYPGVPPVCDGIQQVLTTIIKSSIVSLSQSNLHYLSLYFHQDTLLLLLRAYRWAAISTSTFGSSFEHIFRYSVEYSQSSMEEALKKVEMMEANLGGTEILKPLKHIYSQPCIPSQPRQLFVFTDGEVFNTKEVINLVKTNSGSHRCFSFGIGEGASSALINGLAKEGGGHAQFITETDRMQPKVMQSLRFALQPAVVDITVTWDLPKGVSVTALSPPITALFQGQRSLVYAQLTGKAAQGCVTVKYSLAGHPSKNQLPFSLKPAEDTGLTVHRLGARTLICSLEMEEREHSGQQDGGVKKKVVELSVQSGVSSPFTAFIAVNKSNGEPIQGPVVRRDIPVSSKLFHLCNCFDIIKSDISIKLAQNKPDTSRMIYRDDFIFAHFSSVLSAEETESTIPKQPCRDPLLQVVSLQNASGSWLLDPALADVLGKTNTLCTLFCLIICHVLSHEVWATILALIWLHALKMDAKEEWELLAMKAVSWLRAQNGKNHDSNADLLFLIVYAG